jgi:parallel beta-helix repeat protein
MLLLLVILGSSFAIVPAAVFAAPVACGSTITSSTTLKADIGPCPGAGIVIGKNGITLNCAGHVITGSNLAYGVDLTGRSGVTVKKCVVEDFDDGFYLSGSSNNKLVKNTAESDGDGFYLFSSTWNMLTSNTADGNTYYGFALSGSCSGNTLKSNVANQNNDAGFILFELTASNKLIKNTADQNLGGGSSGYGFEVEGSSGQKLTSNTADSNNYGFYVTSSMSNKLGSNLAYGNEVYGFFDDSTGSGTSGTANTYSPMDFCNSNGFGGAFPIGLCGPQT